MSNDDRDNTPQPLVLNEREQEALTGVLLTMWSRDIEADEHEDRQAARMARRNRLRFLRRRAAPDDRRAGTPTDVEDPDRLGELLRGVRDEAHALQLTISACASEPWVTMADRWSGRLSAEVRTEALCEATEALPGSIDQGTLDGIDRIIRPGLIRRTVGGIRRHPVRTVLLVGGGALAGVATAGVAAPAIGGAIGAQMGLAGAAATNAGLAALGGGSLASGGLGMAGGTALVGALGGAGGAGLGAMATAAATADDDADRARGETEQDRSRNATGTPAHFEAEALQLEALVRVGRDLSKNTREATFAQARLVEIEVARLVRERAFRDEGEQRDAIDDDVQRTIHLREQLGDPKFRLA